MKNILCLLMAVKSLWRPLGPGETREAILERLQQGMVEDHIELPSPVEAAISFSEK